MQGDEPPVRRLFTVDEANELLPRLLTMLASLTEARANVVRMTRELEGLERKRNRTNALQLARSLREARERLGAAVEARREAVGRIALEGVEVKSEAPLLLDFPAWRDGRIVLLCWRAGEPSVAYWHDLDAGFAGRRPL